MCFEHISSLKIKTKSLKNKPTECIHFIKWLYSPVYMTPYFPCCQTPWTVAETGKGNEPYCTMPCTRLNVVSSFHKSSWFLDIWFMRKLRSFHIYQVWPFEVDLLNGHLQQEVLESIRARESFFCCTGKDLHIRWIAPDTLRQTSYGVKPPLQLLFSKLACCSTKHLNPFSINVELSFWSWTSFCKETWSKIPKTNCIREFGSNCIQAFFHSRRKVMCF